MIHALHLIQRRLLQFAPLCKFKSTSIAFACFSYVYESSYELIYSWIQSPDGFGELVKGYLGNETDEIISLCIQLLALCPVLAVKCFWEQASMNIIMLLF